jgi:hypothetical protein
MVIQEGTRNKNLLPWKCKAVMPGAAWGGGTGWREVKTEAVDGLLTIFCNHLHQSTEGSQAHV